MSISDVSCLHLHLAGALFLFSSWYTKKELAARISILYVAAQISRAFGGLLGSAIMSEMDGKAGIPAWRWLCMFKAITFWVFIQVC